MDRRKFGTHIFRYTHISKLAEKGYSLELISKRVGHHDSALTRRIYYHIIKKHKRNLILNLVN
ncbi:tyrosine-type recombinase/integrase [Lactobacillus sp. PV012]|uniref:tyrosine-type recombinase/integrase n=1 Tax=Lactobacillus sp. PV012 TaxID=2594494 RepID=UPI00223FA96C|nr:tyrosine-type recombinase/integrase [Lactobacillus sp. PV012]QNQ82188.1 tyrosine-type recombinase/integrase [Lactobacillus sp. PV012]